MVDDWLHITSYKRDAFSRHPIDTRYLMHQRGTAPEPHPTLRSAQASAASVLGVVPKWEKREQLDGRSTRLEWWPLPAGDKGGER